MVLAGHNPAEQWGGLTTRIDRRHSLAEAYILSRVRATETQQPFMTSVDVDLK